jgi:hypothetical protein
VTDPEELFLPNHDSGTDARLTLVNRQIHNETAGWLWANKFIFASASDLIKALKILGQHPSRHIQHVEVFVHLRHAHPLPCHPASGRDAAVPIEGDAAKALRMLASRARKGELRTMVLRIAQWDRAAQVLEPSERGAGYEKFLAGLRELACMQAVSGKTLVVESAFLPLADLSGKSERGAGGSDSERDDCGDRRSTLLREKHSRLVEEALMELHCAWGGRLICNGVLVWEDYRRVGHSDTVLKIGCVD